jgi:methenyltetrahydrofolate cyclohydrolase
MRRRAGRVSTIGGVEEAASSSIRFRDVTLDGFVARLASAEPVPGGGSASAVAASLGAGLVAMVAALSVDRPKYAQHSAIHAAAADTGRRLTDRFLALADEDAHAFGAFAAALKLPRDNDAQTADRRAALRSAARTAAEVPMACVLACLELLTATESMAGRSNANAQSDLAVAALLGEAAARGAGENVRVNLPSMGDDEAAAAMAARLDGLLGRIGELAHTTREVVASGEARAPVAAIGSTGVDATGPR